MNIKEIENSKLKELKEKSMMLKDERQKGKITYKIWDIVVVVILAVLADCNEWEEIEDYAKDEKKFLKTFLKLTGGIPSAKTYERVISIIDSQELNKISGYEGGYLLTREKSHSEIITYEYYQTENIKWYAEYKEWEGLKSIGLVKKTIEKADGSKVEEKR